MLGAEFVHALPYYCVWRPSSAAEVCSKASARVAARLIFEFHRGRLRLRLAASGVTAADRGTFACDDENLHGPARMRIGNTDAAAFE